ncbi:hypothetical protein [Alkalibacillus aidingensis]
MNRIILLSFLIFSFTFFTCSNMYL